MVLPRGIWLVCLGALPLCAGMVDVSTQSSVVLHDGDSLSFTISEWSYRVDAAAFGAPSSPTQVSFSLLTAPFAGAWDLSAVLESYDGVAAAPAGDVGPAPGYFQGSLYQGPVTTAYGSLSLSEALSSQVFAGPAALLVLTNMGGDVTLGLPPYTLLQDLQVTLSGGGFSVGGTVAAVTLDQAPSPEMFLLSGSSGLRAGFLAGALDFTGGIDGAGPVLTENLGGDDPPDAPEPQTAVLLALGGALVWLLPRALKRTPGVHS